MPGDPKPPPRSVTWLLDEAVLALRRGEHRAMAELVREAWRETRDPGLAGIYALLVQAFRGPPLAGLDSAERAASWRERAERNAGDPLELPVLLDEAAGAGVDEEELEQLRLLEPWSPDPLVASVIARRLRIPRRWPAANNERELVSLFDAQRDPRQLRALEGLKRAEHLAGVRGQLRRTHARLATVRVVALGPEQRSAVAKLERRAAVQRDYAERSAELLAAVYAEPDHDEPRLVYADWLSSHGDPRGEFITLQIERAQTGAPASARERALLLRHANEWSGALTGVLGADTQRFERGFLSAASVEVGNLDGEIIELREWSTLRVLDGHVSDALARRGPLDQLRELYGFLQLEHFVGLRADNRLAAVDSYECSLADPNLRLDTPLGLRTLLVRRALDDALIALASSVAITGLEQLGVYYNTKPSSGADHRERLGARHRYELLAARLPAHVRRLQLVESRTSRASRAQGWVLTFTRDELDVFARLRLDWRPPIHGAGRGASALEQLIEVVEGLGLGALRRLELGWFAEPDRELAVLRLREFADASGCEFVDAQPGGRTELNR